MPYEAYYSARDTIFDFIVKDAFGPIGKNEVLQEPPLDTYVCGILWPKGTSTADVSSPQETQIEEHDDESPDKNIGAEIEDDLVDSIRESNQFRPSVMAISFALPNSTDSISVSFECAAYENIDKPVEGKDYVLHEYKRFPLSTGTLIITLPSRNRKKLLFDGRAMLQIVRRHKISESSSLWTISIENTKHACTTSKPRRTFRRLSKTCWAERSSRCWKRSCPRKCRSKRKLIRSTETAGTAINRSL